MFRREQLTLTCAKLIVMHWLDNWPEWVGRLAWTAGTVGVAYAIGHLARAIVGVRLTRWTAKTDRRWDDALVAFTDRVPFWAILTGAYVSLRHWALAPDDYAPRGAGARGPGRGVLHVRPRGRGRRRSCPPTGRDTVRVCRSRR